MTSLGVQADIEFRCDLGCANAINWRRLSCRSFTANAVRLQLHALAHNLGNFLRTLAMPEPMTSPRHDHRLILQASMLVATREVSVKHFSEIWVISPGPTTAARPIPVGR